MFVKKFQNSFTILLIVVVDNNDESGTVYLAKVRIWFATSFRAKLHVYINNLHPVEESKFPVSDFNTHIFIFCAMP